MLEQSDSGSLSGTVTAGAEGEQPVLDPPDILANVPTLFVVLSGPCTVAEGGRCAGR